MKFGKMLFQNYGSFYGFHVVDFSEKGLIGVFGDNQDEPRMASNGSGKSNVIDAVQSGQVFVCCLPDERVWHLRLPELEAQRTE